MSYEADEGDWTVLAEKHNMYRDYESSNYFAERGGLYSDSMTYGL